MLCRDTSLSRHSGRLACLLGFLKFARIVAYCNFDQNKPSRLLYLGDAQITIVPRESTAEEVSFE